MNPAVTVVGCPCHITHNTAGKAGEAYEKVSALWFAFIKVSKLNVEEMVIDIYYWFDKSMKRKASIAPSVTQVTGK